MGRVIALVLVLAWMMVIPAVGTAEQSPAADTGNGSIAFVSDGDIFTINPDGTGVRQLTDHPAADYRPRWSPDGTRLAFTSDRDGDPEIYVMDTDGGNEQRLTVNPSADQSPVWSPDGTQILFERSHAFSSGYCPPGPGGEPTGECQATELFLMEADGSGTTQLTENPFGMDVDADWSPDGTRIVFNRIENPPTQFWWLAVYDFATNSRVDLFGDDPSEETGPAWSPDGSLVGMTRYEAGWDNAWVVRPDNTERRNLSQGEAQEYFGDWRSDGAVVAYTTRRDGHREVYTVDVGGNTRTNLTSNPADDSFAMWSPDGRLIAFDRDGELWLMDAADGSGQRTLAVPADDVDWQPLHSTGAPACHGEISTVIGTAGADTLIGTPQRDVISGLGGDDIIRGLGGNDLICAGDGNDAVYAGSGVDLVFAGSGDDRVYGQGGNDRLKGEAGDDYLRGGPGQDVIWGGSDRDVLRGGSGADTFYSRDGARDTLKGGWGIDRARADGHDRLWSVERAF